MTPRPPHTRRETYVAFNATTGDVVEYVAETTDDDRARRFADEVADWADWSGLVAFDDGPVVRRGSASGRCPCPCTTGAFCGGCGHAGCGRRP